MLRSLVPLIALGLVAGCNSNPDPSFKQSAEDRAAANAGDPYDALSYPPRLYTYSNADTSRRPSVAMSSAATLSGTIQSMIEKMRGDKKLTLDVALEKQCSPAISASLTFQANSEMGNAATAHAAQIYAALTQCRDDAIEQSKIGGNKAAYANLLRRIASNGMDLVGMTLIAKGDEKNGLKIWREGDALIVKDKPGFQFGLKSLRGY